MLPFLAVLSRFRCRCDFPLSVYRLNYVHARKIINLYHCLVSVLLSCLATVFPQPRALENRKYFTFPCRNRKRPTRLSFRLKTEISCWSSYIVAKMNHLALNHLAGFVASPLDTQLASSKQLALVQESSSGTCGNFI